LLLQLSNLQPIVTSWRPLLPTDQPASPFYQLASLEPLLPAGHPGASCYQLASLEPLLPAGQPVAPCYQLARTDKDKEREKGKYWTKQKGVKNKKFRRKREYRENRKPVVYLFMYVDECVKRVIQG